jgi:hypothetical protein
MLGSTPRPTSIRKRVRYLTTLTCVLTALVALGVLANGHVIHSALLMLATMVLIPGSIWGRRHRMHAAQPIVATVASAALAVARRWRKAA